MIDGASFIRSQGTHLEENIPTYWNRPVEEVTKTFHSLELLEQGSIEMLTGLIRAYADLYKIHLFVILATDGNYSVLNDYRTLEDYAFVLKTQENKLHYLFYQDICGEKLTTFGPDTMLIRTLVEESLKEANRIGMLSREYPLRCTLLVYLLVRHSYAERQPTLHDCVSDRKDRVSSLN